MRLLLDTHAMLWLDSGAQMAAPALLAIDRAAAEDGVLVSAVSAWELGLLVTKGHVELDVPPLAWLERFLSLPGVRAVPLSFEAALLSALLPEPLHGDPADCLLAATARQLGCPIVTRDARLLAYAEAGHVQAIAC